MFLFAAKLNSAAVESEEVGRGWGAQKKCKQWRKSTIVLAQCRIIGSGWSDLRRLQEYNSSKSLFCFYSLTSCHLTAKITYNHARTHARAQTLPEQNCKYGVLTVTFHKAPTFIHPSSDQFSFLFLRSRVVWKLTQVPSGKRLVQSPAHHRANLERQTTVPTGPQYLKVGIVGPVETPLGIGDTNHHPGRHRL